MLGLYKEKTRGSIYSLAVSVICASIHFEAINRGVYINSIYSREDVLMLRGLAKKTMNLSEEKYKEYIQNMP